LPVDIISMDDYTKDPIVVVKALQNSAPVVSNFAFFKTVEQSKIENFDYTHVHLWSLANAVPLLNPINNQRLNVVCPAIPNRTPLDSEPDYTYCNPSNTINLQNVNILYSEKDAINCVVNTPSLLKMVAPKKSPADNLKYFNTIDTMAANNEIPTYTSLASPCYVYGSNSTFDIEGSLDGVKIMTVDREANPRKCLLVKDPDNRLYIDDCPTDPTWKLQGLNVNDFSKMTLSAVSDYLLNYNYYYMVNLAPNDLKLITYTVANTYVDKNSAKFVLENAEKVFNAPNLLDAFDAKPIDINDSVSFARFQFIEDPIKKNNYLKFGSVNFDLSKIRDLPTTLPAPLGNFIGLNPNILSTLKLENFRSDQGFDISDKSYKFCYSDKSPQGLPISQSQCGTPPCFLPPIKWDSQEPVLLNQSDENDKYTALEFILVEYPTSPNPQLVYSYLIRLKTPFKVGEQYYSAYLSVVYEQLYFLIWPVENNGFDYSITISPYLQCLIKTFGSSVKWSFTNVENLSSNESGNLRTYKIQKIDNPDMCLTKKGFFKDGEFVCNSNNNCLPYLNKNNDQTLNMSHFAADTCKDNSQDQQFFFQSSNYSPNSFPYLRELSISPTPVIFNQSFMKSSEMAEKNKKNKII
jgi:hypothetical protein